MSRPLPSWPPGNPPPPMRFNIQKEHGVDVVYVPQLKPRLYMLLDDYAKAKGVPWCCSYSGFCARGRTMEEAYRALEKHFRTFFVPTPIPRFKSRFA